MREIGVEEFVSRRRQLMAAMGEDAIAIIAAASLKTRNRDSEYPFRQDSDFHYLCGFPEPDAVLVLCPGAEQEVVLFCLPRDPAKEVWTGYRVGPQAAAQQFALDCAHSLDEIDALLPQLMQGRQRLLYSFSASDALSGAQALGVRVRAWRKVLLGQERHAQFVPQREENLDALLHEMRLFKSPAEAALMRVAGSLTADAHCRAMRRCKPGMMEYQLEATIRHCFAEQGYREPAYGTIVGGGANGCILHYTENRDELRDGDLVLIDAGCEVAGYAGDITRTFPVNGRFSEAQRALYELVLRAQTAAIEAIRPGVSWNLPHERAVAVLTEGLLQLGLLQGERDRLIAAEAYRPFYMHRTGHWLGLDVHDVGEYQIQGDWRELQEGMVLTVEPGLYVAPGMADVDPCWHGIGIRIEDDILVTGGGCEVLTRDVPKTVAEIEALMAGGAA